MFHLSLDKAIKRLRANDSTLTTQEFGYNKIGDEGALALADALKRNNCIKVLWLCSNQIGADGAKALADALTSNNSLTHLVLSGNNIGDEGATAIADALKSNTSITKLGLHKNQIGDDGAKALVNALTDKRTSAFLHLRNNFGDWSATVLADAGKYNSTLQGLYLDRSIGEDLKKKIQDLLERNKNNICCS